MYTRNGRFVKERSTQNGYNSRMFLRTWKDYLLAGILTLLGWLALEAWAAIGRWLGR